MSPDFENDVKESRDQKAKDQPVSPANLSHYPEENGKKEGRRQRIADPRNRQGVEN